MSRSTSLDWALVIDQIKADDPAGMDSLYPYFNTTVRYFLCMQFGPQDVDDRVHDVFLLVVAAIRRGSIQNPQALVGYIRTIVQRYIYRQIKGLVKVRTKVKGLDDCSEELSRLPKDELNPEQHAIRVEALERAARVFDSLSALDREILEHFYVGGQKPKAICEQLDITETQFRLRKSRAKAKIITMSQPKPKTLIDRYAAKAA